MTHPALEYWLDQAEAYERAVRRVAHLERLGLLQYYHNPGHQAHETEWRAAKIRNETTGVLGEMAYEAWSGVPMVVEGIDNGIDFTHPLAPGDPASRGGPLTVDVKAHAIEHLWRAGAPCFLAQELKKGLRARVYVGAIATPGSGRVELMGWIARLELAGAERGTVYDGPNALLNYKWPMAELRPMSELMEHIIQGRDHAS